MASLKILAWNTKGAANNDFRQTFHELDQKFKPNIALIFETRVGGPRVTQIIESLGFDCYVQVDPLGFFGGLWLLWKIDLVSVMVHAKSF